jgi:hypothetical protein
VSDGQFLLSTFDNQQASIPDLHQRGTTIDRKLRPRRAFRRAAEGRAGALRPTRDELHLTGVTGDLAAVDPACRDRALLFAHSDHTAGNRFAPAGIHVAQDDRIFCPELDHLTSRDIVHELNTGDFSAQVLHQRDRALSGSCSQSEHTQAHGGRYR